MIDSGLARLRAEAVTADRHPLQQMVEELMQAMPADGAEDDTVLLGLRWSR